MELFSNPLSPNSICNCCDSVATICFSVLCALVAKYFSVNAFADMPIHQGEFCIDIDGHAVARLVDYLPQVVNQRRKAVVVYGYVVVHGVSDIVRLDYARVPPSCLFCFAKLRQFSDMAKLILEAGMAG